MDYDEKLKFFDVDSKFDLFRPFSFHFVSMFSSSSRVYFAFTGVVFGFFYSRIIGMILSNIYVKMSLLDKIFIFSFIFILPFTSVQFVRFSTAIVVFLYFILKFFLKKKSNKYLILACIGSIFIHFSFVLPAAVLILFVFLPKKMDFYIYAFVISSFFVIVEFSALKVLIATNLPSYFESKSSYLNEGYAESVVENLIQTNWYIQYRSKIVKYITLLLLFYTRNLVKKGYIQLGKYKNLLLFGLFLGTIANIVSVVPSVNRFLGISYPIIWIVLTVIHINGRQYKQNNYTKLIVSLFFAFQIIVGTRITMDTLPVDFFASNPILILFGVTDIPIIDFIK
jgi:hypothetical protein